MFLDADVVLQDNFLEKALKEFERRNLDVAGIPLDPQTSKKMIKFFFDYFYNYPIKRLEKFVPCGSMCFLIKKKLHQKIKGFNEEVKINEDYDYIRRAAKNGRYGSLRKTKISVSLRRFYKDGWVKVILKYLLAELHYYFLGPVKSDVFYYKFGHYKSKGS